MRVSLIFLVVALALPTAAIAQTENVDEEKIKGAGIRTLHGEHVTLYTDVRDRADVDELCKVFDKAVPQWCEYFAVPIDQVGDWHISACVIADRERFEKADLFPKALPPFPAGYQQGKKIWLYVQDGNYYTRHLLLHEGTHAFMQQFLGGYGPPWFAEGMAEWLGLHRWNEGKLQIGAEIESNDDVPHWGRVKLLREDYERNFRPTLVEFMQTPNESFRTVNSYAWAWAICELLGRHPEYKESFAGMKDRTRLSSQEFNRSLYEQLGADNWESAEAQWQIMMSEIEYGYDIARSEPKPAKVEENGQGYNISLDSDRGWQTTGIDVVPGVVYQIVASGMYVVKNDGKDWEATADGVTIEYFRGKPLGMLLAAVQPNGKVSGAMEPIKIGSSGKLTVAKPGKLYLKINDSPAQLDDNRGSLQIEFQAVSD